MAMISQYCRKKNSDSDRIATERDIAVQQKIEVMKSLDQFVI